jgi:hypothetical protein
MITHFLLLNFTSIYSSSYTITIRTMLMPWWYRVNLKSLIDL